MPPEGVSVGVSVVVVATEMSSSPLEATPIGGDLGAGELASGGGVDSTNVLTRSSPKTMGVVALLRWSVSRSGEW